MKRVAVVGLSPNPERPSNIVSAFLISRGYEIFPVNPLEKRIFGLECFPSIESLPKRPELVVVFRKPSEVPAIVESSIKIGAKGIWLQEGIVSQSVDSARKAGLVSIENRCFMKEILKLENLSSV